MRAVYKVLLGIGLSSCATALLGSPASSAAASTCERPVYLTFDTGHMQVAPLVAEVLARQQVRATFFLANEPTRTGGTSLDEVWAPWWRALAEQGHRARIDVISPRAIFPPAQAPWQRRTQPNWPDQLTPARLVRFMRHYLPSAPPQSSEWQCAWEELRPDLNQIWRGFTDYQRRILMKRFGWLWNLYRFRAGPQTIAAFEAFKATGQIQFVLGRAKRVIAMNSKVKVILNTGLEILGDRVINCTGVGSDRLLNQLIADHCAIPDALAKAVAVDTQFRVLKPDQQPWNDVWMIGPATMGSLGDVVAASAIAKQAEQLASQIKSLA